MESVLVGVVQIAEDVLNARLRFLHEFSFVLHVKKNGVCQDVDQSGNAVARYSRKVTDYWRSVPCKTAVAAPPGSSLVQR